jgi:hypothetical protein
MDSGPNADPHMSEVLPKIGGENVQSKRASPSIVGTGLAPVLASLAASPSLDFDI